MCADIKVTQIVRKLQEAVISVAISDDGMMCAAGTVGAKVRAIVAQVIV